MAEKSSTPTTTVVYNAECPVCSWEIDHYRAYAETAAPGIEFCDLNDGASPARIGVTEDEAARRLYVIAKGERVSGIPAFTALWREMPRYRVLARLFSLPGVHWIACALYDRALAPLLYRRHLRRQARRAEAAAR
ncbi:MAG: DUF393 domain-containing protein [Pseudomonadota bacterium]